MRRFERTEGEATKFWQVVEDGTILKITFGKSGKPGQTQLKKAASVAEAASLAQALIAEKVKKGFVEVGLASETSPAPVATPTPSEPVARRPDATKAVATKTTSSAAMALLRAPPWSNREPAPRIGAMTLTAPVRPASIRWHSGEREAFASRPPVSVAVLREIGALPDGFEPATSKTDAHLIGILQKTVRRGFLPLTGGATRAADGLHVSAGVQAWQRYGHWGWIGMCAAALSDEALLMEWNKGEGHASLRFAYVLARLGTRALPGVVLRYPLAADEDIAVVARVDASEIAHLMAEEMLSTKTRKRARAWLAAHAETAAATLIPIALGAPGKARDGARLSLDALLVAGKAEVVRAEADRYGQSARAAIEATLSFEPLARLPAVLPSLGPSVHIERLAPPRFASGAPFEQEQLESLVTMILVSTPEAPYAGTRIVRDDPSIDRASLATFAWEAFEAWLHVGAPSKEDWPLAGLAAFGDDEVARRLAALVRRWPGESQHARAVKGLEVLAAIGTDVALMLLHGIAEKVKFAGLKERAREKIEEIADARGLGLDELGDRLVPDLGLDADGSCTLDFGDRTFRVGFDEHLDPFVRDGAGKKLADLPKPQTSDDARRAADATSRWKALKKDVRAIAGVQVGRLERAMCLGRRWSPEVFRTFLVGHPLVVHLARRLVWGVYEDGRLADTFRVTEDRSLATVVETPLVIGAAPREAIGIVHRLELDDASADAWRVVFADYELLPPFRQLDRETFRPLGDEATASVTRRFERRIVPTKSIVGLLARGWQKGVPQDAGWIWDVTKKIASSETEDELTVALAFGDGNGGLLARSLSDSPAELPLGELTIHRTGEAVSAAEVTFGRLSPAVFSEIVRDLEELSSSA